MKYEQSTCFHAPAALLKMNTSSARLIHDLGERVQAEEFAARESSTQCALKARHGGRSVQFQGHIKRRES